MSDEHWLLASLLRVIVHIDWGTVTVVCIVTFFLRVATTTFGGTALVTVPMLIWFGLSPAEAVGTNRVAGLASNFALKEYQDSGLIDWRLFRWLVGPGTIGALIGAASIDSIPEAWLQKGLGVATLLIALFLWRKKDIGITEQKVIGTRMHLAMGLSVIAGMCGGVASASGTWFLIAYMVSGMNMLKAGALKKAVGMVTGCITAVLFGLVDMFTDSNVVNWPIMIAMMLASAVGSIYGVRLATAIGNEWLKKIFMGLMLVSGTWLLVA